MTEEGTKDDVQQEGGRVMEEGTKDDVQQEGGRKR